MSEVPKDLQVDVDVWASYENWFVHDVTFLVLGVDPEKLEDGVEWTPSQDQIAIQKKVRRILHSHRVRLGDRDAISPLEVVLRLERGKQPLHRELADAVLEAHEKAASRTASSATSATTRKYNKLLKMYLYLVVAKYDYVPKPGSPSVTSKIINDTELLGGVVDDQTILSRLMDGLAKLNDTEKTGLAKQVGIKPTDISALIERPK